MSLEQTRLILTNLVDATAKARLTGSFSERHPMLGKMVTCPFCHKRRRLLSDVPCCNARYATTQRAYSDELGFHQVPCDVRVTNARVPHTRRRMQSHTHAEGQRSISTVNVIHQRAIEFREHPEMLQAAKEEMQYSGPTDMGSILVFAEKYSDWRERNEIRRKRNAQKQARRINFGLSTKRVTA